MTNVSLPIVGPQEYEQARVVVRNHEPVPWTGPRSLLLWDFLIALTGALAALKLSHASETVLVGTLGQGARRILGAGCVLALGGCAVSTVPGSTFTSVALHDVASYAGRIGACSVAVLPGRVWLRRAAPAAIAAGGSATTAVRRRRVAEGGIRSVGRDASRPVPWVFRQQRVGGRGECSRSTSCGPWESPRETRPS